MKPVLILERVHARDASGPGGRARGALTEVTMALGPGIHAVLGAPEDGTLALFDAVTGARAPQRGRLTVGGRDPMRAPSLRARIGALSPEPRLPSAPTVGAAIQLAMRARGEAGDRFDAVIDPLGLGGLHARSPRSLSFAEERAVELGLALSTPGVILLALHEPLADVMMPRPALVRDRLRQLGAAGACVLVTTSSPSDARELAERVLVLHKGLVVREAASGAGLVPGETVELCAWVHGGGARSLAVALARRPEVRGVSWDDGPGPDGGAAVRVRGDRADPLALALIDAATDAGVTIEAIAPTAPVLGEVRAASETLLQMARARANLPPAAFARATLAAANLGGPPPPAAPPPVPPRAPDTDAGARPPLMPGGEG